MRDYHFAFSILIAFINPLLASVFTSWSRMLFPALLLFLGFWALILHTPMIKNNYFRFLVLFLIFSLVTSSIYAPAFTFFSFLEALVFISGFFYFAGCGFYLSSCNISSKLIAFLCHSCFFFTVANYLYNTKDTLSLSSFLAGNVNRWSVDISSLDLLSSFATPNSISLCSLAFLFLLNLFQSRNILPRTFLILRLYPICSILFVYSLSSRLFLLSSIVLCVNLYFSSMKPGRLILLSISMICVLSLSLLTIDLDFIFLFFDNVFRFTDPVRGVDSGASGRFYIWESLSQQVTQMGFLPRIFGSGILSARRTLYFSLDNAYLGHFYELGVSGVIAYLSVLSYPYYVRIFASRFSNGIGYLRKNLLALSSQFILLSLIYSVIGLFEYRGLSVSNPLSFVYLVSILSLSYDCQLFRGLGKFSQRFS